MSSEPGITFIFATAPGGQHLKITLVNSTHIDENDIKKRLLNAGIPVADLEYVSFSYDEASPTRDGMEPFTPPNPMLPPLPKIAGPDDFYPRMSSIVVNSSVTLSELMNMPGGKYCMKWPNKGYTDVLANYVKPQMNNPGDTNKWFNGGVNNPEYLAIVQGRVRLSFGYVWLWANRQNVPPGIKSYNLSTTYKEGMSTESSLQVSSTLGVNVGAVSASLTITFGYKVSVTKEKTVSESIDVQGIAGETAVFSQWELAEIFLVETQNADGTWLPTSNYTLGILAKHQTPVTLYDTFNGNIDGLEEPLRIHAQTFPTAG